MFKHSLTLAFLLLLAACQQRSENASFQTHASAPPPPPQTETQSDEVAGNAALDKLTDIFSSSAARPGAIDSLKKFVRTADIRFRVRNTADATLRIEDIALHNGGFVIHSALQNEVQERDVTPISSDSAVETVRFAVHSQLTLRVPYRQLDTTLRSIGRLAELLEGRTVHAEDISLQLLEQELTRLREAQYQEEQPATPKPERLRDSRAAVDAARLETLKMEDDIRFSTLTVNIYQLPQIRQQRIANTKIATPVPPFAARAGEALRAGGELLQLLALGLMHLWAVLLLMVLGWLGWRRWQPKTKFIPKN